MTTPRVVITGFGVVTPLGCSTESLLAGLLAGRSGVGPITLFDPAALPTRIAAQINDPVPGPFADRKANFALAAAEAALADATAPGGPPGNAGAGLLSLGLGLELFRLDDLLRWRAAGDTIPAGADPGSFVQVPADPPLHAIARRCGLRAPPVAHISACAASADAVGHAFHAVRRGRVRWAMAGGADSMVNPMGLGGFCKIAATTRANELGAAASRPFDRRRDGFVLGEGAALLVLETRDDAERRGARIYGELLGYANALDGWGVSEPHPGGRGALAAMRGALADAGVSPDAVDYVNAHGTGTPKNDVVETLALREVFGDRAERIPVSSTKSMTGHLIGASGAVEIAAAVLAARAGFVHPTINLAEPDPRCDLDYVPGNARRWPVRTLLTNSFAFGGQNASLVVGVEGAR